MDDKLLVRIYNVGFGDCIYVRIPDGEGSFHLLIDCGPSASADRLKPVVEDVRSMLPPDQCGKVGLDLLVATHPHADHIKGFDPKWFEAVQIRRIWLSPAMKPDHPQAKLAHAAVEALQQLRGLRLAPGALSLLERSVWNPGAIETLREGMALSSGIYPQYPLYVARDLAGRLTLAQQEAYGVDFEQGTTRFRGFQDQEICLRVLAPEWDIDRYYLGEGTTYSEPLINPNLRHTVKTPRPNNISERDFWRLRSRLLYSPLLYLQKADRLWNNTSVVLLLEWRGRRLLFSGDAEWKGTGVEENRRNCSWDVMLHHPEVEQILVQPLDLLKVAHHGSIHGTPYEKGGRERILQKMVCPDRTQVLVSTISGQHGYKDPVPYPPLMEELGRLAYNKRTYWEWNDPQSIQENAYQPQRTDLERETGTERVRYVDVALEPASD